MKQILSYIVEAMILSVSSIAMVAALLARDIFGQRDPYVALVFVLLCILRLTLFTTLSAHLLGEAFPKLRFRNGICLLIILGHAVGIGILGLSSSWWYIVPIVLLTVCVPWSLLLLDPPEPAPQKQ